MQLFLQIIFPALFSHSFWHSIYMYVGPFDTVPDVQNTLFIIFIFFVSMFFRLDSFYWSIFKFSDSLISSPLNS